MEDKDHQSLKTQIIRITCSELHTQIQVSRRQTVTCSKLHIQIQVNRRQTVTCSELQMAKMYWKAIVSSLTEKTPKIHVMPRIGHTTAMFQTAALKGRDPVIDTLGALKARDPVKDTSGPLKLLDPVRNPLGGRKPPHLTPSELLWGVRGPPLICIAFSTMDPLAMAGDFACRKYRKMQR